MGEAIGLRLAAGFAVTLAAAAVACPAQAQDAVAGHELAREVCQACHVVDPGERAPRMLAIAPAFRDIANTKGMTPMALRAFLTSPHPKMPNLILSPQEASDVIAYIRSLRD